MRPIFFLSTTLLAVAFFPSTAAADEAPTSTSRWKPDEKLIIGGAAGFVGTYGLALLVRPSQCWGENLCESARDNLVIPFAGPILHAVELAKTPLPPPVDLLPSVLFPGGVWERTMRWIGVGLIAADGLGQAVSVGVLVAGIVHREKAKKSPATGMALTPVLRPSYVGLEGSF